MLVNISCISRACICMASLVTPMLLDIWITWRTLMAPCGLVSLIGRPGRGTAVAGVHDGLGRDAVRLQRQRGDKGLHRRAGLEDVGHRAVAQLLARQVGAAAGVVARVVGQGQHLAGLYVQHHHRAGLGLVLQHRVAHALVGKELHLGVDGEVHVVAIGGGHQLANVLHHAAQAVAHHGARAAALEVVWKASSMPS